MINPQALHLLWVLKRYLQRVSIFRNTSLSPKQDRWWRLSTNACWARGSIYCKGYQSLSSNTHPSSSSLPPVLAAPALNRFLSPHTGLNSRYSSAPLSGTSERILTTNNCKDSSITKLNTHLIHSAGETPYSPVCGRTRLPILNSEGMTENPYTKSGTISPS
jgi:hypothetical protein